MLQEPESMLELWGGARVYAAGARVYASLVIIVSAQVLWVLTLGLWTLDLGLTTTMFLYLLHRTASPPTRNYSCQAPSF